MENKYVRPLFCSLVLLLSSQVQALALEEKGSDLSASVEVAPVFSISLDNPNLAFGTVTPGESKVLDEGNFFNELKCRSNSGRTWYLKAQLVSLRPSGKNYSLAPSYLKYKIVDLRGAGGSYARLGFQEFLEQPFLIYISQGDDNKGREVILRLQYNFTPPLDAPAGNYVGKIIFTMVESP